MDLTNFLLRAGLFKGLTETGVKTLEGLCQTHNAEPGRLIFKEGDPAEFIGIVHEGEVQLRYEPPGRTATEEQTVSVVKPGKSFGWSALVPPHVLRLSSYAGPEGAAWVSISGKELMALCHKDPHIGFICFRNLTRVIAKRFQALEDEIVRRTGEDAMHGW